MDYIYTKEEKMKLKTVVKHIVDIISKGCVLSSIITIVFGLCLKWSGTLSEAGLKLTDYFLILLISLLVMGASKVFLIKTLPRLVNWIIHYFSCLMGFYIVFFAGNKINLSAPSAVFSSLILFSLAYLLGLGGYCLYAIFSKKTKTDTPKSAPEVPEYTPLYRDED